MNVPIIGPLAFIPCAAAAAYLVDYLERQETDTADKPQHIGTTSFSSIPGGAGGYKKDA